jgi:hypothetical protein
MRSGQASADGRYYDGTCKCDGTTCKRCSRDDKGMSLDDPATRALINETQVRAGTSRSGSSTSVARADNDGYSSRRPQGYSSMYSNQPGRLPANMRMATPLERADGSRRESADRGDTDSTPAVKRTAAGMSRPAGSKLSLVNSKRIRLRYAADKVVSASGSPVEVWGTRDMQVWKRYPLVADGGLRAADGRADTGASCLVEVDGDGVYGFSLCSTHGAEAAHGPQAGTAPQMWVAVDTTKPRVQLVSSELQDQGASRKVVIRWIAQDANLGDQPITLCYAAKPTGPWTSISAKQGNSGRYEWTLPSDLGTFVHLRVQATDLMGNVGTADAAHPLFIPHHATETSMNSDSNSVSPPAVSTASVVPAAGSSAEQQPLLMGATGDNP